MKIQLAIAALLVLGGTFCAAGSAKSEETELRIGLARAKITPDEPIRLAGYASRTKPSEGVLADLHAKAGAFEDGRGERAVLLTADVIGYNAKVAQFICDGIMKKTALQRRQILLNTSHTHTGPVIGIPARDRVRPRRRRGGMRAPVHRTIGRPVGRAGRGGTGRSEAGQSLLGRRRDQLRDEPPGVYRTRRAAWFQPARLRGPERARACAPTTWTAGRGRFCSAALATTRR